MHHIQSRNKKPKSTSDRWFFLRHQHLSSSSFVNCFLSLWCGLPIFMKKKKRLLFVTMNDRLPYQKFIPYHRLQLYVFPREENKAGSINKWTIHNKWIMNIPFRGRHCFANVLRKSLILINNWLKRRTVCQKSPYDEVCQRVLEWHLHIIKETVSKCQKSLDKDETMRCVKLSKFKAA